MRMVLVIGATPETFRYVATNCNFGNPLQVMRLSDTDDMIEDDDDMITGYDRN